MSNRFRSHALVCALIALLVVCFMTGVVAPVQAEAQPGSPCHVPAQYGTIQAAVDDAACGDVVLAVGAFVENVVVNRDVNITGDTGGGTVVDGGGAGSVFWIGGEVTVSLSYLTIQNGYANVQPYAGGGVAARDAHVTLQRSTVRNNTAQTAGGGIWSGNGSLTVSDSTITGNFADHGAGLIAGNEMTVRRSTISDNTAVTSGGGISYVNYSGDFIAEVSESTIRDNRATWGGGIVTSISTTHLLLYKSKVMNNHAEEYGGGMINAIGATVTLRQSRVIKNTAGLLGGDLFNDAGCTAFIEQSRVGDIYNDGDIIR